MTTRAARHNAEQQKARAVHRSEDAGFGLPNTPGGEERGTGSTPIPQSGSLTTDERGELTYLRRLHGLELERVTDHRWRKALCLSGSEFRLVLALYRAKDCIVPYDRLADETGGSEDNAMGRLRVLIRRARGKLGPDVIDNFPGQGWMLTRNGRALMDASKPVSA